MSSLRIAAYPLISVYNQTIASSPKPPILTAPPVADIAIMYPATALSATATIYAFPNPRCRSGFLALIFLLNCIHPISSAMPPNVTWV